MARLLIDGPGHPLRNMAVDRALFEVGEGTVVRLYGWSPSGLSIGRFQDLPDEVPEGFVLVRRTTGGGAIAHRDDLTFSISGPSGRGILAGSARATYRVVNDLLVETLAESGWEVRVRGASGERQRGRSQPFLCFERSNRFDLVLGEDKVVGTAQRRGRDRCLIHGSIRLEARIGRLDPESLGRRFAVRLEERLGAPLVPGRLTEREEAAVRGFLSCSMESGFPTP